MAVDFIRRQEDFTCGHCGKFVKGNGYTNHCPFCLYSRHVDINPGDRAAECGGLMHPVQVELLRNEKRIIHECIRCGHRKANKTAPEDDFEVLLEIMRRQQ